MQIKKALSTATAVQGSDNYKLGTATAVLPPPRKTNRITTTVWGDGNLLRKQNSRMDQSRPPVHVVAIELINYEAPVDHVPPHELRLQLNYEAPLHHDEPFEFWLELGRDP